MGYKSFRDVYHKLAIVLDGGYCRNIFGEMQDDLSLDETQINSALVYGYVDSMCGFSYKVLGLTYYEDGDYTMISSNRESGLIVRGECFEDFDLVPIENKALTKIYAEEIEITNTSYSDENEELLRSLTCLDSFRHYDYPDDILALLFSPGKNAENIWVRCTQYLGEKEGTHYFFAELLNEPFDKSYGLHNGDRVRLIVGYHEGEERAICFPEEN